MKVAYATVQLTDELSWTELENIHDNRLMISCFSFELVYRLVLSMRNSNHCFNRHFINPQSTYT